ncbi:MAG: hypothetical protein MJZ68_04835 [archaeon]|nr:hypothetical protein [archaeon]
MVLSFFKEGSKLYTDAIDQIGRKEYSKAKKNLEAALKKGCDGKEKMAEMYIAFIEVGENRGDANRYAALNGKLANCGASNFKFGLTEIDTEALKTECELLIQEIKAAGMDDRNYMEKGQAYINVAMQFAMLGDAPLKFDEAFKGNTMSTASRESLILQAQAYEIMGKGVVAEDPKQGSEYMQMAYNFRRQVGDSGEDDLDLMNKYARSAKCWICGRPVNGEGIHFMAMRSTINPVFRTSTENDIIKPISDDCNSVYVCVPCYTAISNRSDDISRAYYDESIRQLRATERELRAEIESVRRIANMRN